MRESDVLDAILRDPPPVPPPTGAVGEVACVVEVGPGDDLALLRLAGGELLMVGVDQLVDGVHVYAASTPWGVIGRKAVARCVSDVAAMAGAPLASVISVVLPADCSWENSEALRIGLGTAAAEFGAPLVGGDISMHCGSKESTDGDGPLTIAVTVLAVPPSGGAVLRSGSQVGDRVFVSGALGGAWRPDGTGHHLSFTPRVELGQALQASLGAKLHAMMDISDGLGKDASRIGVASGVLVRLQAVDVPCRTPETSWTSALSDGEDYELLFCVDGACDVPDMLQGVALTCVGVVEAVGDGSCGAQVCTPSGAVLDASQDGWDHGA